MLYLPTNTSTVRLSENIPLKLHYPVSYSLPTFKSLGNILLAFLLLAYAQLLHSQALANSLIVDISSGVHTTQNPVEVFLEPGQYSIHPVGVADGGYYDARSPWNGNTWGCFGDANECVIGWSRDIAIAAPQIGLKPSMYDDWLDIDVLQCTQASLLADRPFWWVFPQWDSPLAALEAYRAATAIDGPCVFEVEAAGFVSFFEREQYNPYATGGVSLRLTGAIAPTRVELDVFPGNGANILNPLVQQTVTLLLFGRTAVDLTQLRPETLSFALLSSPVRFIPGGECAAEELNGDGLIDQTCVFSAARDTYSIESENQASIVRLEGLLTSGQRILGQDVVTLRTGNAP